MKYYIDLHIHSALSPCSDNDMTPNNIINMSLLKGLDIIAITDHNSAENLNSIIECGEELGLLVIPGMEIETREEVHVICLFPYLENALEMQKKVYEALPSLKNKPEIFGEQIILDYQDNIKGYVERMLITATNIAIEEINSIAIKAGGVMIPAHVDRDSYSVISNLGMIPEELQLNFLEISKNCNLEKFLKTNPELSKYKFLRSSDAHNLGDILERETSIQLKEKSSECLIESLR